MYIMICPYCGCEYTNKTGYMTTICPRCRGTVNSQTNIVPLGMSVHANPLAVYKAYQFDTINDLPGFILSKLTINADLTTISYKGQRLLRGDYLILAEEELVVIPERTFFSIFCTSETYTQLLSRKLELSFPDHLILELLGDKAKEVYNKGLQVIEEENKHKFKSYVTINGLLVFAVRFYEDAGMPSELSPYVLYKEVGLSLNTKKGYMEIKEGDYIVVTKGRQGIEPFGVYDEETFQNLFGEACTSSGCKETCTSSGCKQ